MKKCRVLRLAIISLLISISTANATVWYVHPDSTLNSIQAGLDSCSAIDTVLVGPGTYYENLTWPDTPSIRLISEDGPVTTIIDGAGSGHVIKITTLVLRSSIINGFTIRNGSSTQGAGIYCSLTHPKIINNIITMNSASQMGGGIQCAAYSEPNISGNTITGNTADNGGGISCYHYSSPTISGNTITGNTANNGGGIYCYDYSSPTIDSCTISGNYGDGVYCHANGSPILHYNNITDNTGYGVNNVDPTIVIDALYNWWGDASGPYHPDSNPGGLGDTVSNYVDFNPWQLKEINPWSWYVHPDSTLNSIQAGIDSSSTGNIVLVAKGTYIENINFKGKAITVKSEMGADSTIIDGGSPANPDSASVVTFVSGEGTNSVLDGFTITNGTGTNTPVWGYLGGGIFCYFSSPTITDNTITGNTAIKAGGGIHSDTLSSPIIINNIITGNTSRYGAGISAYGLSNPTITNNIISVNTADSTGGGIGCFQYSSPTITENTITDNTARWGGGIGCNRESSPFITGNTITDNTVIWNGGGIGCWYSSSPTITDNTITGNEAYYGGGIACYDSCSPTIRRDTVTGNTSTGSRGGAMNIALYSSPTIDYCIISNNNGHGIVCVNASSPVINYNDIIDNQGYGVKNNDPVVIVNAEHNWWGDPSGPYHAAFNPDGLGDTVGANIDFDPWLTESVSGIEEDIYEEIFFVSQCYPNPFMDKTVIEYNLPRISDVNISIYNVLGAKVKTLLNKKQNAGLHTVTWNGRDERGNEVPSGFYFLRLEAGEYKGTRKLLLIR